MHADASGHRSGIAAAAAAASAAAAAAAAEVPIYWIMHDESCRTSSHKTFYIWVLESQQESQGIAKNYYDNKSQESRQVK